MYMLKSELQIYVYNSIAHTNENPGFWYSKIPKFDFGDFVYLFFLEIPIKKYSHFQKSDPDQRAPVVMFTKKLQMRIRIRMK